MNKISRKGFLKIAAAAAMSGVTAGALAACNAASSSTAASAGAAGSYTPGTYTGTAEGISSTVKVTMTFSDSAVTDVVVDTSGETASYGAAAAEELKNQLLNAGSDEIDGVSGSTVTSDAVKKAAKSCFAQAKGEATVTSVQLPTGDETDWLGKEPDIDEAAITETVRCCLCRCQGPELPCHRAERQCAGYPSLGGCRGRLWRSGTGHQDGSCQAAERGLPLRLRQV